MRKLRNLAVIVVVILLSWLVMPASLQTTIANNAADMSGKIVMVADSATGRTVTNLFTFDRGAAVPFAVGGSSLKVTNLDADKLDGLDSVRYRQVTVTTTSTGAQNNFDPSGNIAAGYQIVEIFANPASTLTISGLAAGAFDGQIVKIINIASAITVSTQHQNVGSTASGRFINVATSGDTPTSTGGYHTYAYDTTNSRWRLIEHEQGAWITPTCTAGNFTASTSTWTVDCPGDVLVNKYRLVGRALHVTYTLSTTSAGGGGTELRVSNGQWGGFSSLGTQIVFQNMSSDAGGANALGFSQTGTATSVTYISNNRLPAANWSAAANNTALYVNAQFEVQ